VHAWWPLRQILWPTTTHVARRNTELERSGLDIYGGGSSRAAAPPADGAAPDPRAIPDQRFNQLFAALSSNRDRAMVAFWISTGVTASELLRMRHCDIDLGQQ
jgi:hypothetical protein